MKSRPLGEPQGARRAVKSLPGTRSKGRPPKKWRTQAEQLVAAEGLTPLQYLLQEMRDETNDKAVRLEAAKSAAPYVHARLTAVAHAGVDGALGRIPNDDPSVSKLSSRDLARKVLFMLNRAVLDSSATVVVEQGDGEDN